MNCLYQWAKDSNCQLGFDRPRSGCNMNLYSPDCEDGPAWQGHTAFYAQRRSMD